MDVFAEAHEQRPIEWLLVDDLEFVARGDPAVGQEAQHLRVGVRDPREPAAVALLERLQTPRADLRDLQLARGNRIAVRVVRRVAKRRGDQLLELLG
jgi:hypothetical protein